MQFLLDRGIGLVVFGTDWSDREVVHFVVIEYIVYHYFIFNYHTDTSYMQIDFPLEAYLSLTFCSRFFHVIPNFFK